MNPAPAQADLPSEKIGARSWPWALLALAVCFVAINSESLWIDEAFMASKAAQPTLHGWWQAMLTGKGSDLQMPLYMIFMWAFAKIFGHSEWALRAANIPWFIAGITAFVPIFRQPQRLAIAAVALLCPFAWFYLNEARPYTMQLASSLVIFSALYRLRADAALTPRCEQSWVAVFWLGIIALCGSSLLGVIWAAAAFFSALFLFSRKRLAQLTRSHWLISSLSCLVLALLAIYFVWTLKVGARASAAGTTDARNVVFIAYELLGFGGLGPGRLEIRGGGFGAFKPFAVPLLCYAAVTGVLILSGIRRLWQSSPRKSFAGLVVIITGASGFLLAAGFALHFRVLGRHFTPLLPAFLLLLGLGLAACGTSRGSIPKLLAGGFVILSLASCLSFRFAMRHEKDDYRGAAQAANAALNRSQKVWWSASDDGAAYYHLPLADGTAEAGRALLVLNPTPASLASLPAPDVIIASKPDLYDNQQALENYVRNNPYAQIATLPAFSVWERKSAQIGH